MKIRFCEHNKGKGKVHRKLRDEFPEANIKIKDCIKQCSACHETPVAVVDKKKLSGRDGDDLYHKIIEAISKSGDDE